jgi:hypothetical protein
MSQSKPIRRTASGGQTNQRMPLMMAARAAPMATRMRSTAEFMENKSIPLAFLNPWLLRPHLRISIGNAMRAIAVLPARESCNLQNMSKEHLVSTQLHKMKAHAAGRPKWIPYWPLSKNIDVRT